jgi:hypothetical protein
LEFTDARNLNESRRAKMRYMDGLHSLKTANNSCWYNARRRLLLS